VETLRRERITILQVVPSLLRLLAEQPGLEDCRSLRLLFCGGEPLPREVVERFRARLPVAVYNLYGPTEATIDATCGACAPGEGATVPLGEPIDGVRVVRAETLWRRAPAGAPGELLIGGAGLARGYLGRPALTAERFVPDAFAGEAGARLYRTGDLARELAGGGLEFAGRLDHQVKVRGFRLELGEIEAALAAHPAVREAVVVARESGSGEKKLVAYVVAMETEERPARWPGATAELRAHLAQRLPDYMVPAAFVLLPGLPLSPNGKVDRAALPAPAGVRAAELPYLPPRTPTEERLAAIWAPLLGAERVGVDDDFLALGGHSLAATRMISRVREAFGVELALATVFERPTLPELAAEIDRRAGAGEPAAEAIVALPRGADFPLSFSQERIWFLEQLDPSLRAYQFQTMLRLQGRLDVPALAAALAGLVRRHEIFRTTFPEAHGRPVQRLHPAWEPPLPVVDLAALPAERRAGEIERRVWDATQQPFDLTRLPLVRWTLLCVAPEEHLWVHVEHHLLHDGWSLNLLLEELALAYGAYAAGRALALAAPAVQLADFAAWQRRWAQGPEAARQLAFWQRTLAGRTRPLDLPADRPRPPRQSFRGRVLRTELDAPLADALRAASRRQGVSLFMTLEAAFAALCARLAEEEHPNVGSAVANRRRPETERMIGMIVNNLVLAHDLAGDPTVAEHLARTRRLCLDADAHQDLPFDHVVQAVRPPRDLSRNPLFQVSFSFHDSPLAELVFPGLRAELIEGVSNGSAKFDLNVVCIPRREQRRGRPGAAEGGITVLWEHATDLFETATIERMAERWQALLEGFVESPEARLAELPLLTAAERGQIAAVGEELAALADAAAARWAPVHRLIAARAARAPEAPAIGGSDRWLTYGELLTGTRRMAGRLRALGVGPESLVGVCLERRPELGPALLGVLEAGAAYLPLDPALPAARLRTMLRDAGAAVLVTEERLARLAAEIAPGLPQVLVDAESLDGEDADAVEAAPVHPDAAAYAVYTSGSTGTPKGVLVPHRGLANHALAAARAFALGPADRALQFAALGFDVLAEELFPTWLAGGAAVLRPPDGAGSVAELVELFRRERITVANLPAPLWHQWVAELDGGRHRPPPDLRLVVVGSDAVLAERLAVWRRRVGTRVRWLNAYGPSEATVTATFHEPRAGDPPAAGPAVPIGRPIAGTGVLLLAADGAPAPPGEAGEIALAGAGLARGYLGRPDLTAERFVPHPLAAEGGERLYRTGDRGRFLPDGALEFLGRLDDQVKVRGVRVEPREVEAALAACPGVREAAVLPRELHPGERQLVAWVAAAAGTTVAELRRQLRRTLPAAMVPAAWVLLDALPKGPAGKVDRAALPPPAPAAADGDEPAAAGGAVEEVLAGVWAELLDLPRVQPEDDFFELGGHSLAAGRMLALVREACGVELPARALFAAPTLAAFAAAVERARRQGAGDAPTLVRLSRDPAGGGCFPLTFAQEGVWFLQQLAPGNLAYNTQITLRFRGALDAAALERALREMLRRHEVFRTAFLTEEDEEGGVRPVQRVQPPDHPAARLRLPVVDLSALPPPLLAAEAERLIAGECARPFDVARPPLARWGLLRRGARDHQLTMVEHHFVHDGWSLALFLRELAALYGAFAAGGPSPLAEPAVQLGDVAAWQRTWLRGGVLDRRLSYWRERLAGAPRVLELPADRPRPPRPSFRGRTQVLVLPPELVAEA
ncbi:MAG TPA: amino acid adenylation domain-containing protein, partial [Thermoanaerobaculia bacterium]